MLTSFLILAVGAAFLFFGGNWLVMASGRLASRLGMPKLVIGLTVVAFGTSAPELAVSGYSAFNGMPDVAVGNVLGSNVANFLLVLGIAAVMSPIPVKASLLRLDLPFLIIATLLSYFLARDSSLERLEGIFMVVSLVSYLYLLFVLAKRSKRSDVVSLDDVEEILEEGQEGTPVLVSKVLVSVLVLVAGSRLFIDGAVDIARFFEVSELVIGVTVVALGTSLPEVATTVLAAAKGQRDIAIGNVIGSNIFNLLAVLGISAAISPVPISFHADALSFEFPIVIAITVLCWPIFAWKKKVHRMTGLTFLIAYVAYCAWLFELR